MCWTAGWRARYDRVVRNGGMVLLWRRIMVWAIPGVLLAALAWSLIPHGGPVGPASRGEGPARSSGSGAPVAPRPLPSGEIQSGALVDTDEAGHKRWEIAADDVVLLQGREVVRLKNVRATFYDPKGTPMTVTGAEGRYDTKTREVDIQGNVHGVSLNGRELFCDTLHYSPESQSVTGTGHIRVIEERVIMYADELISDITLGQTKFFGHVHMNLR